MAVTPETECPSIDRLEAMLLEGCEDAEVSIHLERCPKCQAQARTIRKNDDLLSRLRESGIGLTNSESNPEGAAPSPTDFYLSGYEIQKEIHRGAQGIVYKAVQRATNRVVAVKVLLAGTFASERQRARFEREVEIAATLRHPHIVAVHDSGQTGDGRDYLVMEYIDGEPFDAFIRRQLPDPGKSKKSLERVLLLMAAICEAVNHAHQRGIIHRDLKPANVLIDPDGEPHVLDFGLARPIDTTARSLVTQEDSFVGTLAYASPEQVKGDAALIDVRSDVYSLGVMLYEALVGCLPYPLEGALPDVLHAIEETVPVRPRDAAANPADVALLDSELETVLYRALAKEKSRRYQSATALQRDLERYLNGEPLEARRDSRWYIVRKVVRRNWVTFTAAAAAVALLIVFSGTMSVLYRRAALEADKANQIRIFLEDTLGSVVPRTPGEEVTVREVLDEAVHWVDIALEGQPEVQAALLLTIGNSYRSLGAHEEAEYQVTRALTIRRRLYGEEHLDVAQALNTLGLIRRDQKEYDQAGRLLDDALNIRRELLGEDHLIVAMSLSNLAGLKVRMGDFDEARSLYSSALEIRERRLGRDHPDSAMILYQLAELDRRDPALVADALKRHSEALSIRRVRLHSDHPDLGRSLLALSRVLMAMERPDEALEHLKECRDLRLRLYPSDHPAVLEVQKAIEECAGALGESGSDRKDDQ